MAKKPPSALTYTITLRKLDDYMVVSVKDWGISLAFDWKDGEAYTPNIRAQLISAIEKSWIKTAEIMRARIKAGIALPDPSKMALSTEKEKVKGRQIKPLTVNEVSRILGISENSVRRIPKDLLRFRRTKGGHRRYSVGAVLSYQELFNWNEDKNGVIPKPPTHSGPDACLV
jgi:hypothetical protein